MCGSIWAEPAPDAAGGEGGTSPPQAPAQGAAQGGSGQAEAGTDRSATVDEELRRSLRDRGYALAEDAHGLRLTGGWGKSGGSTGSLSPYELVRMAAQLGGGVLPPEKRTQCPHCQAVVGVDDKRCQWCGNALKAQEEPGPDAG